MTSYQTDIINLKQTRIMTKVQEHTVRTSTRRVSSGEACKSASQYPPQATSYQYRKALPNHRYQHQTDVQPHPCLKGQRVSVTWLNPNCRLHVDVVRISGNRVVIDSCVYSVHTPPVQPVASSNAPLATKSVGVSPPPLLSRTGNVARINVTQLSRLYQPVTLERCLTPQDLKTCRRRHSTRSPAEVHVADAILNRMFDGVAPVGNAPCVITSIGSLALADAIMTVI